MKGKSAYIYALVNDGAIPGKRKEGGRGRYKPQSRIFLGFYLSRFS
jgi:hypothetical protein